MRRSSLIAVLCAATVLGALPAATSAAGDPSATPAAAAGGVTKPGLARGPLRGWVENELLVRWRRSVERGASALAHAERGARLLSAIPAAGGRIDHVRLAEGTDVRAAMRSYRADPRVAAVERNLVRRYTGHIPALPSLPNDPEFAQLWGLRNTAQAHAISDPLPATRAGKSGRDIKAANAWATEQGDNETNPVVLAIVDSGVDFTRPDLDVQGWANPGEIPGNGVDDDTNGKTDDINGWNFANNNANLSDGIGHGTHVAGTAAAKAHDSNGVAGVCPHCKIMALKLGNAPETQNVIAAFTYLRQMAIKYPTYRFVANGSFGGPVYSKMERNAIKAAGNANVLTVFAAGNDSLDNDMWLVRRNNAGQIVGGSPGYPASYNLPNVLSVAATNHNDEYGYFTGCNARGNPKWKCAFTNWGAESVDLGAPGVDIMSTVPLSADTSGFDVYNGTSMAAPHVAGAAGLVRAHRPSLGAVAVKNALMKGAAKPTTLGTMFSPMFGGANASGKFSRTGGRLDAAAALLAATTNQTPNTDGNVSGARGLAGSARGDVRYPTDINDVFKKRLTRGAKYEVRLSVPRGKDYDLFVWRPGTIEIWQNEPGCWGLGGPCNLIGLSAEGAGTSERIVFTARKAGVHYFHVMAWLKNAGSYTISIRRI